LPGQEEIAPEFKLIYIGSIEKKVGQIFGPEERVVSGRFIEALQGSQRETYSFEDVIIYN